MGTDAGRYRPLIPPGAVSRSPAAAESGGLEGTGTARGVPALRQGLPDWVGWEKMRRDGMRWGEIGWVGRVARGEVGRYGTGLDGTGWDGTERYGAERDREERDETGWSWTERDERG